MPRPAPPAAPPRAPLRPDRADLWLAAAAALLALAFAWSQRRTALIGDGPAMVSMLMLTDHRLWWHVLPLPSARLLAALFGWEPFTALSALGPLSSGVAAGALVLAGRLAGLGRPLSLASAAWLVLAPGFWLHASVIEVHALHTAHLALVLSVVLELRARWATGAGGAVLAVLALASLVLSHRSAPLALPGLALLYAVGPGGCPRWGLAAGVAALAAGLGLGVDALLHAWLGGPSVLRQLDLARFDYGAPTLGELVGGELLGPAGVLALGFCAPFARRDGLGPGLALATLVYPLWVLALGIPTEGGYLLPALAPAALGLGRLCRSIERAGLPCAALLVVVQAGAGWSWTHAPWRTEREAWARARVARLLPALPEGAVLLSVQQATASLAGRGRGVLELDLTPSLRAAVEAGLPVDAVVDEAASIVTRLAPEAAGGLFWSVEWRTAPAGRADLTPYLEALEALLRTRFGAQPARAVGSDLWVLEPLPR